VVNVQGSVVALHDTQTEQGRDTNLVSRRQFGVLDQECRLNGQEEVGQGVEGYICQYFSSSVGLLYLPPAK
jgi:hypothetical protein